MIKIGVDEAGYGPLLGPLTSCAYLTSNEFSFDIKDSKKLFQNKKFKKLETACLEYLPSFDNSCFFKNRTSYLNEPWHRYLNSNENDDKLFLENSHSKVILRSLTPHYFNFKVKQGLNKAEILLGLIEKNLNELMQSIPLEQEVSIFCDRLGGRKMYSKVLETWGANIHKKEENQTLSSYEVTWFNKKVNISFMVKGDTLKHEIAAASCFAKLFREYSMLEFNQWWNNVLPSIKPTAGYYTDGKRFIKDIELYLKQHNISTELLERAL